MRNKKDVDQETKIPKGQRFKSIKPFDSEDLNKKYESSVKHRHKSKTIKVPKFNHAEALELSVSDRRMIQKLEESMLRACMSEGMTREETLNHMGLTEVSYQVIEKRLLADDGQRFLNMSTAHRYYSYALQQEQCTKDLEHLSSMLFEEMELWHAGYSKRMVSDPYLLKDFPSRPSPQAMIMAVKAKSEIAEKTLKVGQEMGIIEKRVNEIRVSGNVNLAALPTGSLRTMLQEKLDDFKALVDKGDLPPVYKKMIGKSDDKQSVSVDRKRPECIDGVGEKKKTA